MMSANGNGSLVIEKSISCTQMQTLKSKNKMAEKPGYCNAISLKRTTTHEV